MRKLEGDEYEYELNDFDKSLLPKCKRLSIPIGEPLLMRQVADILRGLAMQLDHNSRRADMKERARRFMDITDINSAGWKIKDAAKLFGSEIKEGRPAAGIPWEQEQYEGETVKFPWKKKTHPVE